jgi:hypothetical protein
MFIGVAVSGIGKMIIHNQLMLMIGVLVSLAGMFLTAYPYVTPPPHKRRDSGRSSQPEVLISSPQEHRLPAADNTEYIPSITERTTNLLEDVVPARSQETNDEE